MGALRTLHIYTPVLGVGGGELSLLRLGQGLASLGVAVTFVVHRMSDLAQAPGAGVRVISLDTERTLSGIQRLAHCLAVDKPQALLTAFPHSNVAAVLARAWSRHRCTLVLSEHAPLSRQVQHMGGWRYKAMPVLMRMLYPRADAVVAVSRGVADDLLELSGQRVHPSVIYNPILPADLAEQQGEPAGHAWLHDSALEVVMSVSRLSVEKDIPTLLRAFKRLHQRRPQTRLIVAGDGPERNALASASAALGLTDAVHWAGMVRNPFAWLTHAKAFALASRFEGFGNVLVEAMACGVPVVSTDCPVGPREILRGGELGALVPVGDDEAMADALVRALTAGAPAAAGTFATQFTAARSSAAYLALLESRLPGVQVASPC